MALTNLARNSLIAIACSLFYVLAIGYANTTVTFLLFTGILLALVERCTVVKEDPLDCISAMCIHKRGVTCPPGNTTMSTTQNAFIYFENKLDFDKLKQTICDTMYRYKSVLSVLLTLLRASVSLTISNLR